MSTYVFVLMLENRSFDHMLGFSGIAGVDAVTGAKTQIDGLSGGESNSFNGAPTPFGRAPIGPFPWTRATNFRTC